MLKTSTDQRKPLPNFEHLFATTAQAPGGVARLRELILTLAVQGKLVPQDPSDEPASELLKKIRAEKERLIAEGKIKKDKPLSEITDEEKPFELPVGWEWIRISDVAYSQAGFAFKSSGFNTIGAGLPLIRIRDVGFDSPETYFSGDYRKEFLVSYGDWLISMDGEFRVRQWKGSLALLNQRVSRLIFYYSDLPSFFITTALQFELNKLQGTKAYTTVDHLSGAQISNAVIALPPLAEQSRIVARVEALMRLCDALEEKGRLEQTQHQQLLQAMLDSLTQTQSAQDLARHWQRLAQHFDLLIDRPEAVDALEQTILQLAVRGLLVPQDEEKLNFDLENLKIENLPDAPYSLPKGWCWVRLGNVTSNMGSGWSPACLNEARDNNETWAVLKTTAIQVNEFHPQENKVLPSNLKPRPEIEAKQGDVLITRAGPMNRVGICCYVNEPVSKLMLSDKIVRFTPDLSFFNPEFFMLCLNSGWTKNLIEKSKSGMAASQVNISQKNIKDLWVPMCDLEPLTQLPVEVLRSIYASQPYVSCSRQ